MFLQRHIQCGCSHTTLISITALPVCHGPRLIINISWLLLLSLSLWLWICFSRAIIQAWYDNVFRWSKELAQPHTNWFGCFIQNTLSSRKLFSDFKVLSARSINCNQKSSVNWLSVYTYVFFVYVYSEWLLFDKEISWKDNPADTFPPLLSLDGWWRSIISI